MMGRIVGQRSEPDAKPNKIKDIEPELGGQRIRPHPDLPFEEREPGLVEYVPDLGGARQGDDAPQVLPKRDTSGTPARIRQRYQQM